MSDREQRYLGLLRISLSAALLGAAGACGSNGDGNGGSGAPETGENTAEAAAATETTVVLGTFTPSGEPAGGAPSGRLPAEGDRAIYVPSTTLFPGAARLDPAIENPYGGDPQSIAAGERHFEAFNCAGCHAPLGGGGMGPPLTDDEWIYGSEPAQVFLSIMHGRPEGMPAWSSMLPRRTAWEMVAYIETLDDIDDYAAAKGFETNVERFADIDPQHYDRAAPDAEARQ